MSRKMNRAYKKGAPFRDFRKFVIVAEGQREDEYFNYFGKLNRRVVIEIVPRDGGKSAAKHLLDRLMKYKEKNGIEAEDLVWFVLDVDNWPRVEIDNLYYHCSNEANWHLSISNPCFEVWLVYHLQKGIPNELDTPKKLKEAIPKIIKGGYKRDDFAPLIAKASENAERADKYKLHYYPELFVSKVYSLGNAIISFLGNNWKA